MPVACDTITEQPLEGCAYCGDDLPNAGAEFCSAGCARLAGLKESAMRCIQTHGSPPTSRGGQVRPVVLRTALRRLALAAAVLTGVMS